MRKSMILKKNALVSFALVRIRLEETWESMSKLYHEYPKFLGSREEIVRGYEVSVFDRKDKYLSLLPLLQ